MVNPELVRYIKYYKNQGYSKVTLRSALNTYPEKEVETALKEVFGKKFNVKPILFGLCVLILIAGLVLIVMMITSIEPKRLEIMVDADASVSSGGQLDFKVSYSTQGIKSPINLEYTLNSAVDIISQGIGQSSGFTSTHSITVPIVAPGVYILKVSAKSDGEEDVESIEVQVTQNAVETVKLEQVVKEEVFERMIQRVIEQIKNEPSSARALCTDQFEGRNREECLSKTGILTGDVTLCRDILNNDLRDTCYMNIMIDKRNYVYCTDISDATLRSQCTQWSEL